MSSTIRRRGPDVGMQTSAVALAVLNAAAAFGAYVTAFRRGLAVHAVVLVCATAAVDVIAARLLRARTRPGTIDDAARHLQSPVRMRRNTARGARRVAAGLGYGDLAHPGLYLGRSVRGGRQLWATWEDMYVEISGPGTGKTTARAIPNIIAAPGPVIVTSAKHHIVEATRAIRDQRGRTWVFDPQQVSGERPTWYWSPLSMVAGSLKEANQVAALFVFTQREPHHRTDAYFDPAAQSLIALLLFAADAGKQPITDVLAWLRRPTDDTPLHILRDVDGHHLAAQAYEGLATLPATQRAGVYGAAVQYMSWLGVPEIIPWITPGGGREEFPFVRFARESTDTLYVMSMTDDKTSAPVVSAITAASVVAGETGSATMPGGRLRRPLLVVLDEPANVAQLPFWPNRYSHFGSRGIVVMTMLQSWAQGVGVWGPDGMAKLWGAASVRVYGGGGDARMIDDISVTAGLFEAQTTSMTRSAHALFGTMTRAGRPEPVLHPSDVANLRRGRLLVQISGHRPVLAESAPWTAGPYSDQIRASIAQYGRRPRPRALWNP